MAKPTNIKSPAYEIHTLLRGVYSKDKDGKKDMGETAHYHDLLEIGESGRSVHSDFWEAVRREYSPEDVSTRFGHDFSELDRVDIGRVYSYTHVIESMVMNRDPVIELSGVTPQDKAQVDLLEEKSNLDWQQDKSLVREVKLCARDCIQTGRGILWTGMLFDPEELKRVEKQTKVAREAKEAASQDALLSMSMEEVGREIAQAEAEAPLEVQQTTSEQDDRITTERVNSFRVAPEDFVIDPECMGVWNMKWCARRVLSTVDAVKADSRYQNTADISGTTMYDLLNREPSTNHPLSPFEYVEIWEFWERTEGGWSYCYIARDHDKFLIPPTRSPFWIGLPVAFLEWNETGLSAYNPSDFVSIWSVFLEEKLSRTQMYDGFSREQTDRTFFDENLGLTEEDMKWYGDPETGYFCPVQNPDPERPLANYFFRLGMEAKSPDRLNYQMRIDQDIQTGIGIGPNQIGQALKSSTSASEAMEVASFARARGSHKYEATEVFVGMVSKIRMGIAIQHIDVPTVAREMGPEAGEIWAAIKRDWSEAEVQRMMLVVRIGSMRPVSEDSTFQKLVGILNLAAAHPVMLAQLNLPALLREAVKSLGFRKTDGLVLDNDPQEVSAAVAAQAMMGQQGSAGQAGTPGTPGQAAQFAQG